MYFAWLRDIAFHDLGVRVLAAWTFLALAGLGRAMTVPVDASAGPSMAAWSATISTAGRLLIVAGLFGALGQLVELGGHQAAIAASASLAPPAIGGDDRVLHRPGRHGHRDLRLGPLRSRRAGLRRGCARTPRHSGHRARWCPARHGRVAPDRRPCRHRRHAAVRDRVRAGAAVGAEPPRDGPPKRPAGSAAVPHERPADRPGVGRRRVRRLHRGERGGRGQPLGGAGHRAGCGPPRGQPRSLRQLPDDRRLPILRRRRSQAGRMAARSCAPTVSTRSWLARSTAWRTPHRPTDGAGPAPGCSRRVARRRCAPSR